jgi:hypothetical protein
MSSSFGLALAGLVVLALGVFAWRRAKASDAEAPRAAPPAEAIAESAPVQAPKPPMAWASASSALSAPPIVSAPAVREKPAREPGAAGQVLAVTGVRDDRRYGYHSVEGQVKNLSSDPLHDVTVVVRWFTPDGDLFAKDEAVIETGVLAGGHAAAFKVLTQSSPAMARYALAFMAKGAVLAEFRQADLQ